MGGYGGSYGKTKEKCYYDTGGHKVKDKNAVEVAEHYIAEGKYVAFLQEKPPDIRADLSVEGQHVEVKGLTTLNPDNVEKKLHHAFLQILDDDSKYPSDKRIKGKVVILSRHASDVSDDKIYDAMKKGFLSAKHKGYVTGECEVWIRDKIYKLE